MDRLGPVGLSQATLSHIHELSYEMLKDPEYQEWISKWAKGFLTALARGFRAKEAEFRKKRKARRKALPRAR